MPGVSAVSTRRAIDRAMAAWRRRELQFPARVQRMTPDEIDRATGAFPPPTYRIVEQSVVLNNGAVPQRRSITCLVCGFTSYHPRDVSERYCAHCCVFHEDR